MNSIHSILFVELLGGIGDIVIALPAIHALARSHPHATVTVLTFAPGAALLQPDPWVGRVVVADGGEARRSLDQLLATTSFDLIVSDTNYDGIANRIQATTAQTVTNLWRSPPDNQWVSDRFLAILLEEGVITATAAQQRSAQLHLTTTERQAARVALGATYRPLVVLCFDAGMAIKRWSIEHFVQLGQALQRQQDATILIAVGAVQAEAEALARSIGGRVQLWQRGSLRSIAAMLGEADLVIAADTGLARIAAAVNTPTITLFGPSWQGRYGQPTPHINLQGVPDCPERVIANFTEQRCWYSGDCPFEWATCVDTITPEQVMQAAVPLLHSKLQSKSQSVPPVSQAIAPLEHSAWRSIRRLLVMRLDNIGDVIMTSPALRSLRQALPNAEITLMTSPGGALTAPLLPWVDEVLPWRVLWQDLGRLEFDPTREWQLVETLRCRQFDAAIIFTSFSQSPHPAALISALAGIPLRLGESREIDTILTHAVSPAPDEIHQVDRNLRLIEAVGFVVDDRRLTLAIPSHRWLNESYIVLNPWTSCQSRNYDPIRFATAARLLSDKTGYAVVVTGVEKDRERSYPLFEILGDRAVDVMGKTSLPELVGLIAAAELLLTNNTSTMHIADATQTPNVVLFAGTELECQWRPRHSPSRLLRRPTVCNPCYAFTCAYELQCLDIPVEAVVMAGLELLS